MNIYMTGGTGFIGSYVVNELANGKNNIHILARNPNKVPALKKLPKVKIYNAPMHNYTALKRIIKNPDALIHIALCWGDTGPEMIQNETIPSVRLIELGIKKGAKKIIFTSSTAAGGYAFKKITEDSLRLPEDFYGATKGAVELFMKAYAQYFPKIKFNVVRPGYTFGNPAIPGGSWESDKRFINICKTIKKNRPLKLDANDGTQFIWAGHLAKIYSEILKNNISNEIFYGLSNNFVPWAKIAQWAKEIAKSKSKIQLIGKYNPKTLHLFSLQKIKKYFNLSFNPTSELKKHIKWILENASN